MTDNRFLWEYDEALGFDGLCGIDEVGRGPLAGPVCAACVVLPRGLKLPALNDSKKMTEKRREETYTLLTACPEVYYGIGFASQQEIDEINILQATFLAMHNTLARAWTYHPEIIAGQRCAPAWRWWMVTEIPACRCPHSWWSRVMAPAHTSRRPLSWPR